MAVLLCATSAHAQQRTSAEKAAAESLFDHAMEYLKAGDLQAACENFEKSQKIDPAVGTLLYLAECYERTGRTASAWATFREAASLARALRETDRATIGDQRAARLESQLSRVTIDTANVQAIANLTVLQDGVPLNPALFGASIPIDPGSHTLRAEAPGYEPWTREFVVEAGARATTLDVPMLVAKPVASPAEPIRAVESKQVPLAAPEKDNHTPTADYDPTASLILMGSGLAFIGGGVGFGIHAKNLDDRAARDCEGKLCATRNAEKLSNDAQQAALFSNIAYGVGAAAIITGGILLLVDGDTKAEEKFATFQIAPTPVGGHLWYQGTF
jgi:hypothetical protein